VRLALIEGMISLAGRLFQYQANGSLIERKPNRQSELIGQNFTDGGYFHGRPSATSESGHASGECRLISRIHASSRKPATSAKTPPQADEPKVELEARFFESRPQNLQERPTRDHEARSARGDDKGHQTHVNEKARESDFRCGIGFEQDARG
jgi:hypothetical protein